ncbi:MAG: type IV pilus secretin PilQ family protein [Legionellaceae bacterium]|nr:type IV pilus secretin PilQ family protein [Legionellaceae bacterium]
MQLFKAVIAIFWILISVSTFAKENSLVDLKVIPLPDNRLRIDFIFSDTLYQGPASFITQQPARLVLDFIDSHNDVPVNRHAQNVNLTSLSKYHIVAVAGRVRAILDLTDAVSHSGYIHNRVYSLILSGKSEPIPRPQREIYITNTRVKGQSRVESIDFRGHPKNGGRLIINLQNAQVPINVTQSGKEVVISLQSTTLPQRLAKKYDVVDFNTPAQFITARQLASDANIRVLTKGDFGHFAYQMDTQFIVDIFPLTEEEIKAQQLKKKVFTGKRISLNFQDIPIRSVLQLLAEFTGINMVVSDQVSGNITLRLNHIPWDQALDIILMTHALDKRRTGNVMLIAPAKEIRVQEEEALKSQEEVQKLAPLRSDLLQINYAKAADIATLLKDKNTNLLSERGKISVDVRTNTIWIQDTGAKIEEIRELIAKLDVPVKQVLIESRIVLVNKDFEQDLGIRFGVSQPNHLSGTLDGANQINQGIPPADVPVSQRLNLDLFAPNPNAATLGVALAKLGNGVLLDLELSALEVEGKGEVISSPRLITSNQQAAVIESGDEIPYQEATSSGATAVAFKKAVLSLKVTPQITPDNKILMDLQINQDSRGQAVNNVPSIVTKAIQTHVLVDNGQTLVLGGIYKQEKDNTIHRVPLLGELPVIGYLFRNNRTIIRNEELLIFITPKIITDSLSITTIEGHGQVYAKGAELDKFGKPVTVRH